MKTVIVWLIVLVLLIYSCSMMTNEREYAVSPALRTSTPYPTWTNTAIASQLVKQERAPDATLALTGEPPTAVPVVRNPTSTPTPQVPLVTINHNMNIRGGPGTNYPVIGSASVGQEFPIIGKNHVGDWWNIIYKGHKAWVFSELVTATNAERVQVPLIIPTPPVVPTTTRVVVVAATPVPTTASVSRCNFDAEFFIPQPSSSTYDCTSWEVAYRLVVFDRPEVLFSNFDKNARIRATELVHELAQRVRYNCNASIFEVAGLAIAFGDAIDAYEGRLPERIRSVPRIYILGHISDNISGTLSQCHEYVAGYLYGLFE